MLIVNKVMFDGYNEHMHALPLWHHLCIHKKSAHVFATSQNIFSRCRTVFLLQTGTRTTKDRHDAMPLCPGQKFFNMLQK